MATLPVAETAEATRVDICAQCEIFWFDPKEFEEFSVAAPPSTTPRTLREPPGF